MSTARPRRNESSQLRPDLERIEALLCEALAAPRTLTSQVLQEILAHHGIEEGHVASWLADELAGLESYEQDLLLSPLFTPGREERLGFEEVLGHGALEAAEVEELIERLSEAGLLATLVLEEASVKVPLPPVAVDRFVRLLHLEQGVPEEIRDDPAAGDPEVRCLLRDRTWQRGASRRLLPELLEAARRARGDFSANVRFLTDFVRTHRPRSREECLTYLENLAAAYEEDLRLHESGRRPFFSEELKAAHAGRWSPSEDVVATHRRMIATARALQEVLG